MRASSAPRPDASGGDDELWRHPAFFWTMLVLGLGGLGLLLRPGAVGLMLAELEIWIASGVDVGRIKDVSLWLIPPVAFGCGILASVSPCILPLVPLNVAYIGAAEASGRRALRLSALFVLGAALALSVLGLFGDLAGVLLIDYRGPVSIFVGLSIVYFGLAALELAPMPALRAPPAGRDRVGPMGVGAVFVLVTTPCASPLLAAVLAAAAAQAVFGLAALTMACFALGYTLLVFVVGVLGGSLVARLRRADFSAPRAAAAAILLASGAVFVVSGVAWF